MQASCIGIVEALSQVGSFVAPIVVTMSIDWQVCPMIMLAVCLFAFAIAPMLFLKDTEKV